jgi:hypothetical protein
MLLSGSLEPNLSHTSILYYLRLDLHGYSHNRYQKNTDQLTKALSSISIDNHASWDRLTGSVPYGKNR